MLLSGCAAGDPAPSAAPAPGPEEVLLGRLIADKERTIGLYTQLIDAGGKALEPFRDRHRAHLAELRRRLPVRGVTGSPAPSGSVSASPSRQPRVTLARLREVERRAAAQRPGQLAGVSPALAQLIASIGACEALHVVALPRSF